MLNSVVLIGRLTADPTIRYLESGKAVAKFTLAVDRGRKDADGKKQTDFLDIVVWEKQAENCAQYLAKGSLAAVDGSIQARTWEDQEGKRRKAVEVIARSVRFLERKKTDDISDLGREVPDDDAPF